MPNENKPNRGPLHGLLSLMKHESNMEAEDARAINNEIDRHEESQSNETRTESERKKALDIAADSLRQEGWRIQVDEEKSLVLTNGSGSNGTFNVIIDVKEEQNLLIVYVLCPVKVPEGIKRAKVAEFLTRANYGAMIGNFELDFRDGEVRYKGGLEWADGVLTMQMVERLVQKCAFSMNHYFPGVMKIVYGDVEVLDAIREIEPSQAIGDAILAAVAEALNVQVVDNAEEESAEVVAEASSGEDG